MTSAGAAEGVARSREARRIVYVASRWGEPSQTFVRREARAVQRAGVEVAALSLKRPAGVEGIEARWLRPPAALVGFVRALLRRPLRCVRLFGTVVARSRPRNLAPQLGALFIGIAWVGSRRLPMGHIHAHFGWVAATVAWAAASLDDRTFSVYLHAFELHDRRYVDRFTRVPLCEARATFTHCDGDADLVAGWIGRRPTVARLALPTEWFAASDEHREPDLVVCVGRLVEKKGHRYLLDALTRASDGWRCTIVGDGPLRADLERRVARLGLEARVTFAGELPEAEVRCMLRRAAVMALTSVTTPDGDRDGSPMAIVEAMASRVAVVASAIGGVEEMLGDAGLVVPPGDVEAIAVALDSLRDERVRHELVTRAVARVRRDWRAEVVAARVLEAVA